MAKNVKTDSADPKQPERDEPEARSEDRAEEQAQDPAATPTADQAAEQAADEPPAAAADQADPAERRTGGREAAGNGPSVEELMPGIGEALAKAEAAEAREEAARVAALEAENAQLKDRLLRALAEVENIRRRAERDRKDAETYGGTRLARDLLAVHDNLTRALKAADDEIRAKHGAFLEGVELTLRELLNAFAKHRIEKVEPQPGEKFDPNRHQAMFEASIPGAPSGSIVEVMESGFSIADRLLRPAMVGVARGGQPAARTDQPGEGAGQDAAGASSEANGTDPDSDTTAKKKAAGQG